MRLVKLFVISTGGLIVLGLLFLFLVGRRPEAGRVTGVVELEAPPAAVMPWLTEAPRLRRWVGWLTAVDGDTSEAAVGRSQVWHMDDGQSGTIPMSVEITGYAPPDSLSLHLSVAGVLEGDNRYTLTDLGGGRTRLVVEGRYRHPSIAIALLEPIATPQATKKLRADLARLAPMVEQEARETPAGFAKPVGGSAPAVSR